MMAPTKAPKTPDMRNSRSAWPLPTASSDEDSGFPNITDGDVVILVSGSRRYQLHSDILKAVSPVIKQLLAGKHTATLSNKAIKKGVTVRSRLVAISRENSQFDISTNGDVALILEPEELDSEGRSKPGGPVVEDPDNDNARLPKPIYTAYDNVLGAIYNRPMDLGDYETDGLDEILKKAINIVDVAEYLGVERIVTSPIEATLLATGQKLFRAIAEVPTAWLRFAHRAKSRAVYREALIHAVGKYNHPQTQEAIRNGDLPEPVAKVLMAKGEKLKDGLKRVQRKILSYYPPQMHRTSTLGRADINKFGRASYANDIFWWMTLTLYRSWAADKCCADKTHHAEDMGFEYFSLLHRSGEAYLSRNQIDDFRRFFPLSAKGLNVVDDHLNVIKAHMKERYADQLFVQTCHLDVKKFPQKHFTSVAVGKEDFSFISDGQAAKLDEEEDSDGEQADDEDDEEMENDEETPHDEDVMDMHDSL